jgi:hypothetical protein
MSGELERIIVDTVRTLALRGALILAPGGPLRLAM